MKRTTTVPGNASILMTIRTTGFGCRLTKQVGVVGLWIDYVLCHSVRVQALREIMVAIHGNLDGETGKQVNSWPITRNWCIKSLYTYMCGTAIWPCLIDITVQ
jgi:hypothetical protein